MMENTMIKQNKDSNVFRFDVTTSWPDPLEIMRDCNSKIDHIKNICTETSQQRISCWFRTVHDTEMIDHVAKKFSKNARSSWSVEFQRIHHMAVMVSLQPITLLLHMVRTELGISSNYFIEQSVKTRDTESDQNILELSEHSDGLVLFFFFFF